MIEVLYTAIAVEMVVILLLVFKTPLRKLVVMWLDRLKRGTAPLVVKTVAAVVFLIMSLSIFQILNRTSLDTPTGQIFLATNILQASLLGFLLFLSFMVDKLHHYIRELRILRKTMEAAKKQNRATDDEKNTEEVRVLGNEISKLRAIMKQLETECKAKDEEVKDSQANAVALRNQSEGFMNEYNDLLEQNRHLRDQLQSINNN